MGKIKETRARLGVTQAVFASIINSTQHRVSELETGYKNRSETKGQDRMMLFLNFIEDHLLFDDLMKVIEKEIS